MYDTLVIDIDAAGTEHPATDGKRYCAAAMDAYARRIIGWSIAARQTTELTDALGMAITRRQPSKHSTIPWAQCPSPASPKLLSGHEDTDEANLPQPKQHKEHCGATRCMLKITRNKAVTRVVPHAHGRASESDPAARAGGGSC